MNDSSLSDWLPKIMTPAPSACDSRLRGFRIPLSEAETRRIASLPLIQSNGFDVARITNGFRLQCRTTVQRIDAVSTWENEGGR